MENYICTTCGVQYAETETPPAHCPICEDERQYVGQAGQQWTTLAALQWDYHNVLKAREPDLTAIVTKPKFGIGQRALLIHHSEGNILWDCISLIDDVTIATIKSLGGISAIAISHPHYYSTIVEWSRAFKAPVYVHAADRKWIMRPDERSLVFWEGETKSLGAGLTLIRCGGHYPGSAVLHWADGAEGRGVLMTGDTLQVAADRRYVSFLYSYPNMIPLPAKSVQQIVEAVMPFEFDRIYGAFWDWIVETEAKASVRYSAERYINALAGNFGEIA